MGVTSSRSETVCDGNSARPVTENVAMKPTRPGCENCILDLLSSSSSSSSSLSLISINNIVKYYAVTKDTVCIS